jgi:hypothetical protein
MILAGGFSLPTIEVSGSIAPPFRSGLADHFSHIHPAHSASTRMTSSSHEGQEYSNRTGRRAVTSATGALLSAGSSKQPGSAPHAEGRSIATTEVTTTAAARPFLTNGHAGAFAASTGAGMPGGSTGSSAPLGLSASFPASASASIEADGFRLSIIELGMSIVAPLSLVVS